MTVSAGPGSCTAPKTSIIVRPGVRSGSTGSGGAPPLPQLLRSGGLVSVGGAPNVSAASRVPAGTEPRRGEAGRRA